MISTQRRYAVDDVDFELYRQRGGRLSMAAYFNERLAPCTSCRRDVADSAPRPLSERLGGGARPQSLSQRIAEAVGTV